MENTACRCGSMVQWKAAARRRCYCYLGCLHSRTPDYGVGASEVLLASAHPFPLIHVEGEVHALPSCYGEANWSTVSGDEERHCGEGRCTMDARPPPESCAPSSLVRMVWNSSGCCVHEYLGMGGGHLQLVVVMWNTSGC